MGQHSCEHHQNLSSHPLPKHQPCWKMTQKLRGQVFDTIFMCEIMAIVNSGTLTVDKIHDPESLEPLTPNHFFTMKSRVIIPPPGNFQWTDMCAINDGEEFNP